MTEELNPYLAPQTAPLEFAGDFQVDGPHVVVADGTQLPRRCIMSNHPGSDDNPLVRVEATLAWRGRHFQLVVRERRCALSWFESRSVRRRQLRRFRWGVGLGASGLALLFGGTMLLALTPPPSGWLGTLLTVAPAVGLFLLIAHLVWQNSMAQQTLRITRFQGGRFWIAGCCSGFLESVAAAQLGASD